MTENAPLDPATFIRDHVAPRVRSRIEELRAQVKRLEHELADRLGAEMTMELALDGDGGGTWYVTVQGDQVQVAERALRSPLIRVRQTRDDWEALARLGLGGGIGGTPGGGDLTKARVERMRTIRGTLEFRIATDAGDRRVSVQFGEDSTAGPRCGIGMRLDDALRLQAGELTPQAAFLQGLVRLEGDVAFAMQVGAALFM
jgi:hypothetical protein